jgi:uncharacterized protein YdeI (YjbR/CyaY-like superfamily)
MKASIPNPDVDWYFAKATTWKEEFKALRLLALSCGLTEELKWGHPCYTLGGKNVVLMHGFKDYCALLFNKGVLINDEHSILVQQTSNVQAARQARFTNAAEIKKQAGILKRYILQAIELEKSGAKVKLKATAEFSMPTEFADAMKAEPKLKTAFFALTPGRQRGYLLHFASAKHSATRIARIDKHRVRIVAGKGLDD